MKINDSPLMKIVVLFSIGIVLGKSAELHVGSIIALASGLLFVSIILYKWKQYEIVNYFTALVIIVLGFVSINLHNEELPNYNLPKSVYSNAKIYGRIESVEIPRDRSASFYLNCDSLIQYKHKYLSKNLILVKVYGASREIDRFVNKFSAGNYVEIKGKLFEPRDKRNPGEFDYRAYLREKGITAQVSCYNANDVKLISSEIIPYKKYLFLLRKKISDEICNLYKGESKHFIKALILGERKDLDKAIVKDFINSGIVHVLAVSGLHVGFIAAIFFIVFGRFNIFMKGIFTIIAIVLFMFISGLHPSVIRASVMAVLMILAMLSGRKYSPFNILALAALLLLVSNPAELFDPGFQLSFAAVFSILFFYPPMERYAASLNISSEMSLRILKLLLLTFAAQLGTLPITLIYFKKLSLISFFVNLIAVPLIGLIVAFAVASLIFSTFSFYLGLLLATTNRLLIDIMFYLAKLSANTGYSYLKVENFNIREALFYYFLLMLISFSVSKFHHLKAKALVFFLSILIFFTYSEALSPPFLKKNKLYVISIDIGQGDSFFVEFPDGTTALIDAGNASKYFDNGTFVIEPLLNHLGIDKIDYLLISHIDADHYRGSLSLIKDGLVKQIYKPIRDIHLAKDVRFENFARKYNVPINYYHRKEIHVGNARMFFLNDTSIIKYKRFTQNNKSGLIKICYGEESFLFTGDLEKQGEKLWCSLYGNFLHADVLKVGHHGSKTSTGEEFLKLVNPKFGLISVGENNKFGHPNLETLRILDKFGVEIKRTDRSGAIVVCTDGKNLNFIDWKN